jgi:hypothetical protein
MHSSSLGYPNEGGIGSEKYRVLRNRVCAWIVDHPEMITSLRNAKEMDFDFSLRRIKPHKRMIFLVGMWHGLPRPPAHRRCPGGQMYDRERPFLKPIPGRKPPKSLLTPTPLIYFHHFFSHKNQVTTAE